MEPRFKSWIGGPDTRAVLPLLAVSAASVALTLVRTLLTRHTWDLYLIWNLFLAWVPLFIALGLLRAGMRSSNRSFWSWAVVWLLFFPNAPYLLTDLIHLPPPHRSSWWTELVLHLLFAMSGLVAGFLSLRWMQRLVTDRHGVTVGRIAAVCAIVLAGLGLYIGRVERWNSWDVVVNPLGLLLDIPSWINLRSFKLIVLFTVLMLGTHGLLMALAPAASLQQEPQRRKRSILELP